MHGPAVPGTEVAWNWAVLTGQMHACRRAWTHGRMDAAL